MESGIQLMFDLSPLTTYPEQTVIASAHLVRTSQSQDSEKDLTETEAPSFEKYFGYLGNSKKKIDLNGLSTKMLRECYQATEIRKLTPLECFRLQGWTDDYFEKAAFVNSDSQLYKQAGNGVTVDVVQAIAEKLKESESE